MKTVLSTFALAVVASSGFAVTITSVEPTPLFPKPAADQPLNQTARLHLDNPGEPIAAIARITVGSHAPETQELGVIAKGKPVVAIQILDIAAPTPVTVEVLTKDGKLLASQKLDWQPQKKWTLYCCSYSHQDLGFGDYPHRLRTSIRHENIKLPLRFCRETDDWPDDAKYRFNIETSEPITSFISFTGKDAARELGQRLREDRLELGGLQNAILTEELSHELMARLFYMTGRYAVDLLGVPAGKVIQNDDIIGLTWPLATYAKEAGFDYCFLGFNRLSMPNMVNGKPYSDFRTLDAELGRHIFSIGNEPNFYWEGPDGQRLLRRATTYERNGLLDNPYQAGAPNVQNPARVEFLIQGQERIHWPFQAMLSQDGGDYLLVKRTIANRALKWNAQYEWPRLRVATFEDYFQAIEKEITEKKIKLNTIAADENNLWADQNYTDARTTGQARRLEVALPATETYNTMAQALAGGGDQWINRMEAYHRLLQYYEHTNAKNQPTGNMVWYETELEENREMVAEAGEYQAEIFTNASQRLDRLITRTGERNLVVFNPLAHPRTDIVRATIPAAKLVDEAGKEVVVQQLPDGSEVFVASDIPATGYKVYSLVGGPRSVVAAVGNSLESKFYKIQINPTTGAITSLFDKTLGVELVATNAANAFNGYMYQSDGKWFGMEKADHIEITRGPVADVLTLTGKATGVESLKQTIILYHDLKRIDFAIWMDKSPYRGSEAVFVAMPFNVPDFKIHHELPGCVIEPYRQQVDGSCTASYAIRSFTDLSNAKYGVTVSPVEGSLVCYGAPQATVQPPWNRMNRSREYPKNSWLYLYLLNNVFHTNTAIDQRGPVSFTWSLSSHAGDWQAGGAEPFGRSVQQPLMAWRADGKNTGPLPASGSFMTVDAPNVMCSVIKPAEMNGRGYIIRLNETTGQKTTATVTLPLLPPLESARATSLVENDRPEQYSVTGHSFKITLPKFGVKTIRVTCAGQPAAVSGLTAKAVADMQVDMSWPVADKNISHCNIYRDTKPECAPTLLNFIGQSTTGQYADKPRLNKGGWIRSCLKPETTYYYRIVPVDRVNNTGAPSAVATVTTMASKVADLPPMAVEGVRPILVSPISNDNFVNLLFRTACEPDVTQYEIYRGTEAGKGELVGVVRSDAVPPRSGGYGEQKAKYKVKDYDHAFFTDATVGPGTEYYYQVRAVDAAGQKGPFSAEASIRTGGPSLGGAQVTAQSVAEPRYGPALALDGNPDIYQAWISKQYGGGTKDKPLDTWWQVKYPQARTLKGIKIIGDHRDVIPLQTALEVQVFENDAWKTVATVKDAKDKDITVMFPQPLAVTGLRIFVPAADLPKSDNRQVDGIVRICELNFVQPTGEETK